MSSRTINALAARLVASLQDSKAMLVTAESCTGGLIAAAITDIAGSSAVLDRGLVTYSNQAKTDLLGVRPQTLAEWGAVSEQTAAEMVFGAWQACPAAEYAVAVTGIAGPGGGTVDKPVGLVWLAVQKRGQKARISQLDLTGTQTGEQTDDVRAAVREKTVEAALSALLQLARTDSSGDS